MFAPPPPSPSATRPPKSARSTATKLTALAAILALAGCVTPVRLGPTNPYVLSDSVATDPSGDLGYAYRPTPRVTHRRLTVTTVEHKQVVPLRR